MKNKTGEVAPRGMSSVEIGIEHVRHPRQWMKIQAFLRGKRPGNGRQAQARLRVGIFHIDFVVIVDVTKIERLAVDDCTGKNENRTDTCHQAPVPVWRCGACL